MKRSGLAELALRLLRDHRAAGQGQLGDRAGTVAAIERRLAARTRRRRPLALLLLGAAAAAAVAIIGLRDRAPIAPVVTARLGAAAPGAIVRTGVVRPDPTARDVVAGDRLRPSTAIDVTLSTGTTLALGPSSDLELVELGFHQRLSLQAGVLRAHVHKLRPGEEFSVTTPDAQVSVRGTEFEVAVARDEACGGRNTTHVQVFEGVVAVVHDGVEARLGPAQTWTTPCHTEAPSAPRVAAPAVSRPRAAAPTRAIETAGARSTLAEQNELLSRALTARRQGDLSLARHHLDELLTRFPRGPLTEPATRARRELASSAP